jgi:hypothetical protein
MKRRRIQSLLCLIGVLVVVFLCLRGTAAPTRTFSDAEWFFHERQKPTTTDLQPDADIYRMINRAQRDYVIAPSTSGSRFLHFGHAWNVEPNDVYLAFGNGEADLLIVYRCTREKGKLLWKALEFQSP